MLGGGGQAADRRCRRRPKRRFSPRSAPAEIERNRAAALAKRRSLRVEEEAGHTTRILHGRAARPLGGEARA